MADDPLDDFTCRPFTHDGKTRDVYWQGDGPAVIVMAEMPGITPAVATFARRIVALGCTAVLPVLFGTPGRDLSVGYGLATIAPACVSREFTAWATHRTSPIIEWLRVLATDAFERCGGPGVGAIGMCWTGGFALGMMVDDHLLAPVLSQPSLPLGFTKAHRADVGISDADLARVKARAADDGVCVLGLRFTGDRLSPGSRFATLRRELGDNFIGVEIDSSPGNPHGIRKAAHSVVTDDLVDEPGHPTREALDQVLDFFRERLLPA
jgi:dienelactone hydrolase